MKDGSGNASGERVARHRAGLRARGMRPIQIWVPDTRAPHFAAEARRQALAVASSEDESRTMDWLEDVAEFDDGPAR